MALLLFSEMALFLILVDVKLSGVRSLCHGSGDAGGGVQDAQ